MKELKAQHIKLDNKVIGVDRAVYVASQFGIRLKDFQREIDLIPDRNGEITRKWIKSNCTYESLAQEYNISRERVRQIVLRACHQARYNVVLKKEVA